MIVKGAHEGYNYLCYNTSNGKVYFYGEKILCIETNNNGPDVVIQLVTGRMIYVKDPIEEILKEVFG